MKELTISLIIPAHNEEKYIGDCLDYVIKNSNAKLLEIIVVDNASTDKTSEIARKYPGVKVIREDRKGVMWAREKGRLEAKGEILAFMDADNRMSQGWVEKIQKEFSKNNNLVCLSGPYVYYDISRWRSFLVSVYNTIAILMSKIIGFMVTGGNFAIRKDILDKMNGLDTSIDFYGDDTSIGRNAHKFGKVLFKKDFFMYSSGRRFSQLGIFRSGIIYASNFFSQAFMNKSITKSHKDFR